MSYVTSQLKIINNKAYIGLDSFVLKMHNNNNEEREKKTVKNTFITIREDDH